MFIPSKVLTNLKTKKTVVPMTTPSPAKPIFMFIQNDERDSGIVLLKCNRFTNNTK